MEFWLWLNFKSHVSFKAFSIPKESWKPYQALGIGCRYIYNNFIYLLAEEYNAQSFLSPFDIAWTDHKSTRFGGIWRVI